MQLPDFRRPSTALRTIITAETVNFGGILYQSNSYKEFLSNLAEKNILLEVDILFTLIALAITAKQLFRTRTSLGVTCAIFIATAISVTNEMLLSYYAQTPAPSPWSVFQTLISICAISTAMLIQGHWNILIEQPLIHKARLHALSAKMRPHFIFNSLNCVLALIPEAPKKAEDVLINLCDLLRSFMNDDEALRPLSEEKKIAEAYLNIEKTRFGEKLRTDWEWDARVDNTYVPNLIIQPLIENSVIHGISKLEMGGTIYIKCNIRGSFIFINIKNNYSKEKTTEGNGFALKNIKERLQIKYGGEGSIHIDKENGVFGVTLKIPIDR